MCQRLKLRQKVSVVFKKTAPNRNSLRDIYAYLKVHSNKLYHIGIKQSLNLRNNADIKHISIC